MTFNQNDTSLMKINAVLYFLNIFTNAISLISVTTIDSKTKKLSINSIFYLEQLAKATCS